MYYLKKIGISALNSFKSKKLEEKIIVFESDDWGSIRTPNLKAAEQVKLYGGYTSEAAYLNVDTLENESDVKKLFETLLAFKDIDGNHPIITANYVMANPDFDKIKASNFSQYFYKPFPDTYQEYFGSNQILKTVKEGISSKLFYPQFHGREHVNVPLWLDLLQNGDKAFLVAFENNFFGIHTANLEKIKRNVQIAFDLVDDSTYLLSNIKEGLALFNEIFGFKSKSFIPNNYVWDQNWNKILAENEIAYLQGVRIQSGPLSSNKENKRKQTKRWGGCYENNKIISIVRNGSFEPSFSKYTGKTAIERCLNDIAVAFLFKQPAVISTHRLNFVSSLNQKNRDINLEYFSELLDLILKKWPEVKFMNTEQLGNQYKEKLA